MQAVRMRQDCLNGSNCNVSICNKRAKRQKKLSEYGENAQK